MFLFILESIGTSELLMIGVVALIFLGPRRLPEIAKKIGKITAEFRGTANEFKQTWQREVDFEEEAKALDLGAIESEARAEPVARESSIASDEPAIESPAAPAIKEVDAAAFNGLIPKENSDSETIEPDRAKQDLNDKRNWL